MIIEESMVIHAPVKRGWTAFFIRYQVRQRAIVFLDGLRMAVEK
jgi:hypothetical protein